MAAALQWVSTTPGRLARDAYAWMQAVHWVHGAGAYQPARRHGPRFGETTVRVAELVSTLAECRPSVDWVARRLELSERTVQYHLGMLREAGLLVYVSLPRWVKGCRRPRQAAVYARVIPAVFDVALGIRTVVPEGVPVVERRPAGIAEQSRKLIGQLAKKAARRRRTPRRTGRVRCTPVQVPQPGTSRTVSPAFPSEAELASGAATPPAPQSSRRGRGPGRLNAAGRSHQLAGELVRRVLWLGHVRGEGKARLAWAVREVAAAGWTADEVIAWLDLSPAPQRVHRPSGLLAARLRGAATIWSTPEQRNAGRIAAAESMRTERDRHDDAEHPGVNRPMNPALAARAWQRMRSGVAAYRARQQALGLDDLMPPTVAAAVTDAEAAAVLAAFLGQQTGAPA